MNIKNTTKFSKEAYYALNKTLASKSYIACIFFELLLGGLVAYLMIVEKDYLKGGIILGLMAIYPFFLTFIMNFQIKRNYEMSKISFQDMVYNYEFTDTQVNLHLINKDKESSGNLTYKSMYKVIETTDFIFLFLSSNQAYIVSKSTFEKKEELETVINKIKSENVKYIVKKSK